jgi:hypothetical protein
VGQQDTRSSRQDGGERLSQQILLKISNKITSTNRFIFSCYMCSMALKRAIAERAASVEVIEELLQFLSACY